MKYPTEYQILKFLFTQRDRLFLEDVSSKMKANESYLTSMIITLKNKGYVSSVYQYKTNNLSCPTYKITANGIEQYRDLKKKRFYQLLSLIVSVCTIVGTLAALFF